MARGGKREGAGRKVGIQNQLSKAAKDVIARVADDLGGSEGMLAWVRSDPKNEQIFWGGIYPKLLPLQLTGSDGGPIDLNLNVTFGKR
jgi:hypothetical protein